MDAAEGIMFLGRLFVRVLACTHAFVPRQRHSLTALSSISSSGSSKQQHI